MKVTTNQALLHLTKRLSLTISMITLAACSSTSGTSDRQARVETICNNLSIKAATAAKVRQAGGQLGDISLAFEEGEFPDYQPTVLENTIAFGQVLSPMVLAGYHYGYCVNQEYDLRSVSIDSLFEKLKRCAAGTEQQQFNCAQRSAVQIDLRLLE